MKKKKSLSKVPQKLENAYMIPMKYIIPDENQPRYDFNDKAIEDLAESIKLHGQLQPIVVESIQANKYRIIVGERRFRAMTLLQKNEIACLVQSNNHEANRYAKQLIENFQRVDLSPIEKAKAILKYKSMLGDNSLWADAEKDLGISETRRKQLVRLLDLPTEIQSQIVNRSRRTLTNTITEGHARALLLLSEKSELQKQLFQEMIHKEKPISAIDAMVKARILLKNQSADVVKMIVEYSSKAELKSKLEKRLDQLNKGEILRIKSSGDSKIEWTDRTWNPASGCTKVSDGCKFCYAEKESNHLKGMGKENYKNGFEFTLQPDQLINPLNWNNPELIFTCSMSDLFHENMPFEYIDKVMEVIRNTPRHIYQILTKRPKIMKKYFSTRNVPTNAWIGVSVENKKHGIPRIPILKEIDAEVKFLSIEPLLEDLGIIDLSELQWVIVGGESGHKGRAMEEAWVLNIKDLCLKHNVPFFFKQWGTYDKDGNKVGKKKSGKVLQGRVYQEFPEALKDSLLI